MPWPPLRRSRAIRPSAHYGLDTCADAKEIHYEKIKHYIRNNSTGAWLLCVFAGGKSRPANRRLWHEYYTSDFGPPFETYAQWHSDGLEIETPNFLNGVCMGTWKQIAGRTFKLFHVGWTPGGIPPAPASVRFELRHLDTVSVDGNSFDGRYDQKFFDANDNIVFEDMGTIHATRLSVKDFADQSDATAIK